MNKAVSNVILIGSLGGGMAISAYLIPTQWLLIALLGVLLSISSFWLELKIVRAKRSASQPKDSARAKPTTGQAWDARLTLVLGMLLCLGSATHLAYKSIGLVARLGVPVTSSIVFIAGSLGGIGLIIGNYARKVQVNE